jgi:rod shape-determining protein MreC
MSQGRGHLPKARFSAVVYVFFVLILLSFSLLMLSTRNFIVNFRDLGLSVFSGARGGVYELSSLASRTVLAVRELASLRRERGELLKRLARYEEMERSSAEIMQENIRLREQLGFTQTLRFRHIPAEIIGRDPDNLYSTLVINKGKHSGVSQGMAVIAFQDGAQALVGKVIQAGVFESYVIPLYDQGCAVSSRLAVSRYEGLVEGQGKPEDPLRMSLIPKRARDEINVGDLVISSGIGGVYPAGINIGRVSAISYREYEISMEAELEAVVDFSRLEYVFALEGQPDEESAETLVPVSPLDVPVPAFGVEEDNHG